jgi:hypothetical protein
MLAGLIQLDPPASDDGVDRTDWGPHLTGAHAYLSGKKWGARWENLLQKMVYYEWAHFHEEDAPALNAQGRPAEIGQWMKEHRRWVDQPLQEAEHGPIGRRILEYWKALGPRGRWDELEDEEKPK